MPYVERRIISPDLTTGKWRLTETSVLHSTAGSSSQAVAKLPKNTVLIATALEVHTQRYQICEFRASRVLHLWEHFAGREYALTAISGDRAAITSYYGEGECVVWLKGRTYVGFCPDFEMDPAKDLKCDQLTGEIDEELWAKVVLADGRSGWLKQPNAKGMSKHGPSWNEFD